MSYLDQVWSPSILFRYPAFFSTEEYREIRHHMLSSPTYTGTIIKRDGGPTIDTKVRRATNVEVPNYTRNLVGEKLTNVNPIINAHFSLHTSGYQRIQFLIYRTGEFFRRHRDVAPESTIADLSSRKVSAVVFLNDSSTAKNAFEGGMLSFIGRFQANGREFTRLDVAPEEGLLIAFPPNLLHEVVRVKRGVRFTLVSWFT
jgi:predicted 2-oxoglutarate/Fe(II)-dependent dioxygenase YbiX